MSALANYFLNLNKQISGYDKTSSAITASLEARGVKVIFKDDVSQIDIDFLDAQHTLVITTAAIPKTNIILNFFRIQNFKVIKRAEALGLITNNTKCLAVAGTHGKTTTSSILGHLMFESQQSVTAFFGGVSENYKSIIFRISVCSKSIR